MQSIKSVLAIANIIISILMISIMIVQMINAFREHGVSISKAEVELFFSSKVSICVKHVFGYACSSSSDVGKV